MAYRTAPHADPLSTIFAALADPTRRAIFDDLTEAPRSVGALAATKPVSRPAVSQHLKVLERAGLVTVSQSGSHRIYAVRQDGLTALRTYLDRVWDEGLAAYAAEISRRNRSRQELSDDPAD